MTYFYKIKPFLGLFFLGLCAIGFSAGAAQNTKTVKNEPIVVDADNQHIDLEKDTLLFSGDVVAVQGTLKVNADRILVEHMTKDSDQIITATGNPVYFEQQVETSNGPELVKGNGQQLVYDIKQEQLTLTGNAIVYKQDGTVKGNRIVYHLNTDIIKAYSGNGQRVNTVLKPNQK